MGETRDHLESNGGPGRILCGKTGTFIIDSSMCDDCPRRICMNAQPGSQPCNECKAECPDWEPDDDTVLGRHHRTKR